MASSFINCSLAQSTNKQYSACLMTFIEWAQSLDLVAFPLVEANLILFVSQLAQRSSYNNIKKHLAALKFFATSHGYVTGNLKRLYLVVRGIRRSHGRKFVKARRLPVTPDLLRTIKYNLFNSSRKYEDKCMLWAAMVVAFFGLLRAAE